jgi:hypothetical protein
MAKTNSNSAFNDYEYTEYEITGFEHYIRKNQQKNKEMIMILLDQIKLYDYFRNIVEVHGGNIRDLELVTETLNKVVSIPSYHNHLKVSLTDQKSLHGLMNYADDYHLDIRRNKHGFPLYYLCRMHWDYWNDFGVIVEDVYRSPGYSVFDERFVKLMKNGKEMYVLRLSMFREETIRILEERNEVNDEAIDKFFFKLGNEIFQVAWHEDQMLGILTAKHLQIGYFQEAVELLYLALGGEFCKIRGILDENMLLFFEKVFKKPEMLTFLKSISTMEGADFVSIPQKAIKLFAHLSNAFNTFLKTRIEWGAQHHQTPLFKILLANYTRFSFLESKLAENETVLKEKAKLEEVSQKVIKELLKIVKN